MKIQATIAAAFCVAISSLTAADKKPDDLSPTGETFAETRTAGSVRVLLAGGGSSHHFPRDFLATDSKTLGAVGGLEVAATPNLQETLTLLPQADVVVFSGNHRQYGKPEFQKALNDFADAGKGIVILHAATWLNYPKETGYNNRFVGGGTRSHGRGDVEVIAKISDHPVMKDVPAKFTISDESYHIVLNENADVEILAENGPDSVTKKPHPSVWIVKDPKTRIVCITHGHDDKSHANPAYQTLLINAVKWVSQK